MQVLTIVLEENIFYLHKMNLLKAPTIDLKFKLVKKYFKALKQLFHKNKNMNQSLTALKLIGMISIFKPQ